MYSDNEDGIMPPIFNVLGPRKWLVIDENDHFSGKVIEIAYDWKQRSIIQSLKKVGVNVPRQKPGNRDPITMQNDIADGVIYVQIYGQDWLTLKELPNAI